MSDSRSSSCSENEPIHGIISKLDNLENTISNLELDVRNELNTQRLLNRCQLAMATKCEDTPRDPSLVEYLNQTGGYGSIKSAGTGSYCSTSPYGECNCRCNQALAIYLDQLRQARLEEEELLRKLKMTEMKAQLYRGKLMDASAVVERQKQEILDMKQNDEQVTQKINAALEQENQTLMDEISRLKRLPEELWERERSLKAANKELQETKLTLKSLLLNIESGLEACEDISGELQQERRRAFDTMTEIDEEKRKVMNWVAKYSELKEQYETAKQQQESVSKLSRELQDKSRQLEQITREYSVLKEESVAYISKVEAQSERQRAEFNEQYLEMECENLRLKVALEEQSSKTSDATHKMQQELVNLEQKFTEAHEEVRMLKQYNEAAAAAAELGSRKKDNAEVDETWLERQSINCSYCVGEDSTKESGTASGTSSLEKDASSKGTADEGSNCKCDEGDNSLTITSK
ncbi:nuclear mitotic apparatus protein 1-like [Culex pipiens pallens]|uniref:nuclear mitotic apparatus protein 1-like n=1 Tax=Culex pipiens pallens TaxID=42434 RepID=UPI0019537142|nr:nuclear mitotic apparatus protein 1-like [Culex pipiens pallens]